MIEIQEGETITAFTMRRIRADIIEECAKVAEGTAPLAAGNFFKARRDQCTKIAAAIRALSNSSGDRNTDIEGS